jgi:hypothetical protein
MSEELKDLIAMAAGVFVLTSILWIFFPGGVVMEAQKKRFECEKNLPRHQQCVMTYVPEADHA